MARAQGRCIFCQGTGLSKEHIFPKWMRTLLDTNGEAGHSVDRMNISPLLNTNIVTVTPASQDQQGHLFNRRLRVVCKLCNGGWMSGVEASAKNVLAKLITGETMRLDADAQEKLSFWTCLRVAVFERDHPPTAAMTIEEYALIYEHRRIPPNWRVFIAANDSLEWHTRIFHSGMKVQTKGFPPVNKMNTQKTIIGMKRAVLHAVSSTTQNAERLLNKMSPDKMEQIHPYCREVNWPVSNPLKTDYLQSMAYGQPLR